MNADERKSSQKPVAVRIVTALMIVMNLLAANGCAGAQKSGSDGHRTGGIALDMLIEHEDGRRSFYRVFPDGTLGFAGGSDARQRRITWTGMMSDEQIEELVRLIDEHGWRASEPAAGDNRGEVTYRIDLRCPEGRYRYRVNGDSPAVMPIYNHVHEIAMQRFEHVIETLPRPSTESRTP